LKEMLSRAAAHVFVADLGRPQLSASDFHHLQRVLRLRPGEAVTASDGKGSWVSCQWDGSASLLVQGEPALEPALSPVLTVGFALTKGAHPEEAVRGLTEAGVDRVALVVSERCVARWPEGSEAHHMARLSEVARQAAMQSRRVRLPQLLGPLSFAEFLAFAAAGQEGREGLALAAPGGASALSLLSPTVLVGPEGGWSGDELAAVARHVRLGPHVLRAGTAAVAAGVLLSALREGIVGPGG
jgi:16S rRNA (uracil1498-N3)-methyltransferase